jgi:hypothetical protein
VLVEELAHLRNILAINLPNDLHGIALAMSGPLCRSITYELPAYAGGFANPGWVSGSQGRIERLPIGDATIDYQLLFPAPPRLCVSICRREQKSHAEAPRRRKVGFAPGLYCMGSFADASGYVRARKNPSPPGSGGEGLLK